MTGLITLQAIGPTLACKLILLTKLSGKEADLDWHCQLSRVYLCSMGQTV